MSIWVKFVTGWIKRLDMVFEQRLEKEAMGHFYASVQLLEVGFV